MRVSDILKNTTAALCTSSQKTRSKPAALRLEALEDRWTPAATPTQIRDALDLPQNVNVVFNGSAQAIVANSRNTAGQLLGFPSGKDSDFLMVSTGVAAQVDTVANTGGSQGTDLGASGATGDTSTLTFTLQVPATSGAQKLKFDFMFLSEEFPEYVNSQFNDFFSCTVNGTEVALDQFGDPVNVNNVFFSGQEATGTFFDGRTVKLSASYAVPNNANTLDVKMSIGDIGDGIYDSAVLIDNVRFETQQVVYLDFDGETFTDFFHPGTSVVMDPFSANDVKSNGTTQSVIDTLLTKVRALYSDFDITFTTAKPASGDYMHVVIGDDNDVTMNVTNPVLRMNVPAQTTLRAAYPFFNGDRQLGRLFGQATSYDFGNLNRRDRAVVFAGEFDNAYSAEASDTIIKRLSVTIAHEVAHNMGARHLKNDISDTSVMKGNSPRSPDATFRNELIALKETTWYDGATQENTYLLLLGVLGPVGGTANLAPLNIVPFHYFTFKLPPGNPNLFNLYIGIGQTAAPDSETDSDEAPLFFNVAQASNEVTIAVPVTYANPTFFFMGSTTPGGPANVFSGTATGGAIDVADMFVPLFNQDGTPNNNIPTSVGTPGSLTSGGTASLQTTPLVGTTNLINVPVAPHMVPNSTLVFSAQNGNPIAIETNYPPSTIIELTLSTANGTMSLGSTTGLTFVTGDGTADATIKVQGSITNVNAALSGMSFTPTNGFTGNTSITIATDDTGNSPVGTGLDDSDVIPINVSNLIVGPMTITGTANNDVIVFAPIAGSTTNVTVIVNGVNQGGFTPTGPITVNGGDGNDYIFTSGALNVVLSANGGIGDDTIFGGNANDTIVGDVGNDQLDGGIGNDLIFGQDGNDALFGQAGSDSFDGGIGNDTIDGGDGDDFLFGQAGADSLIGGNGNDGINGGADNDTVLGQAGIDYIEGGDGADSLLGGDDPDGFDAGAGNDFVDGGLGNDFMYGFAGDDTMFGQDGNDGIDAGVGNDSVDAGAGNDFMYGLDGADTLNGNDGNDGIDGGLGNDSMLGGNGDDLLFGAAGNDSLNGGAGSDSIDGNAGNDTMDGANDNDLVFASGGGIDIVRGGAGNDTLQNIDSSATIFGGAGNDIIYGANFTNDSLLGEDGNDLLFGLSGNDTMFGGAGADTMDGGTGTDSAFDAIAGDVLINVP